MGSFNSTCSVTHSTIENHRVARILLVPTMKNSVDLFKEKGLLATNEGAQGVWSVFGFPIFGTYWDYGMIKDIDRTDFVVLLEQFFNLTIDEILESVSQESWFRENEDKDVRNIDLLKVLQFTDVRQEVYDEMSLCWKEEGSYDFNSRHIYLNGLLESMVVSVDGHSFMETFIPSLCRYNFFKLMKIDTKKYETEIIKMFWFLNNMTDLYRILMPSLYGGQTNNWSGVMRLNNLTNRLLMSEDSYEEVD